MKNSTLVIQPIFRIAVFYWFVVIKCIEKNKYLHLRNWMKQILGPTIVNLLKTGNGINQVGHLTELVVWLLIFYKNYQK